MSGIAQPYVLSPELLAFRDFTHEPPGVWLWRGGAEPFARVPGSTHRLSAGDDRCLAGLGLDRLETLGRLGILLDADTFDAYTDRLATAHGLLADQRLVDAAGELRRARLTVPALTTTWLEEAFTLLRTGATRASRALLEQYLARWPRDPAATVLLTAHEHGSPNGDHRGRVMVLAPSAKVARELALRADTCVERIRALCGYPPNPTLLLRVTESGAAEGRCVRGGSPFARLIELSARGAEDCVLLAHELVHATLSSGNLAFTEGLALHVSIRLQAAWDDLGPSAFEWLAGEGEVGVEINRLFLDIDTQAEAFDHTRGDSAAARPGVHWLAFLGTAALVSKVGLMAFVDYLRWLRDPTPTRALAAQEQLFQLHFGCSLREALRPPSASQLAR